MSDRIKKIKVKKQDGTFSDYIPISADAENINLENGNNLQEEINSIERRISRNYKSRNIFRNKSKNIK